MSAEISLTLTVTMTGDWRIGAGVGRQGAVDSLVVRDVDGLPYAPASTVAAMWRDAAEQLAFGLDETNDAGGGWNGLVTALFGSQPAVEKGLGNTPTPSRLILEHLRLPEELRAALSGPVAARASLRQALTFVKPGVRIDPRRGTAATDMLRVEEICRSGAVLTGRATIDTTGVGESVTDTLAAFAFTSLRLLERIGGGRRRGLGCCEAQVSDVRGTRIQAMTEALNQLRRHFDGPASGAAPEIEAPRSPTPNSIAFGDRNADVDPITTVPQSS